MEKRIKVCRDGPYLVSGRLPLVKEIIVSDDTGGAVRWTAGEGYPDKDSYALCRCGKSKSKPFCDSTHLAVRFDGSETASREPYAKQAGVVGGPSLKLTDVEVLCASARFCHNREGNVWDLTEDSGNPKSRKAAVQQACDCPAGRLVAWDKESGKAIEPEHKPSISLVEDPHKGVSGPIWVKGGVPIEAADGTPYEVRNRVTLCRCGESDNKPFCDGAHISRRFDDGDESIRKKIK